MDDLHEDGDMSEDGGKVDIPDFIDDQSEEELDALMTEALVKPQFQYEGEPSGGKSESQEFCIEKEYTVDIGHTEGGSLDSESVLDKTLSMVIVPYTANEYVEMLLTAESQGELPSKTSERKIGSQNEEPLL
ncbi:hypothetical protein ABZP36_005121 [Zizania latifolia]